MSIANFISSSIILHELGQYETAFALVCSSVDGTAKKLFPSENNNTRNKKFIQKYFRTISIYGFPGISVGAMRIKCPNFTDLKKDKEGFVGIEDILYHIIRCGLVHECELDKRIKFVNKTRIGNFGQEFELPKDIIWGLIVAVLLCENNIEEKCSGDYFITIEGQNININEMWGQESKWMI